MTDHNSKSDDNDRFPEWIEFLDPKGNTERFHKSDERATEQMFKVLATVHGGLGITLAAWLQRTFEHAQSVRSPLALSLAAALFFVATGLLTLGASALYAKRSTANDLRWINLINGELRDRRSLEHEIKDHGRDTARYKRLTEHLGNEERRGFRDALGNLANRSDTNSMRCAIASWVCLALALSSLFVGVLTSVSSLKQSPTVAAPSHTEPVRAP